ncbi:P-loop NTPase family protein [Flavobacterium psychrophilum]|uniref:ATP-binding protein n=1 Tax=Flavobacterium psychrophilum TaxID=96345 RepID=UPI000B7C0B3E|nr:ATP-binding protein [Flavobacterium psychrophilum]MBF2024343.1 ATP-binding protein [Flavobacterium psychrophilum]MCB5983205.1 ATP-binding protein [Flavobacterium psychrophilum]MCB5995451.1 ATP-binding protein [Flavobacterium psychrophilum]MCB5997789.1 ATP-binding protein [Flavobacterium psychrophilum]MCB6005332.1 ATP-binding protein [Flavobacterium psychrophilum]
MARAISTKTLFEKKYKEFEFTGVWGDVLGNPEKGKEWLIYGDEKNGKTLFALKLAEYISQFESVMYISAEEGFGKSFQQNAKERAKIDFKKSKVKWLEGEPLDEIERILDKRQSPKVVFFDNMTAYKDEFVNGRYRKLTQKYPNITMVFVAHEERGEPYTAAAKLCKKLARIIFRVEGMVANITGSCPGGQIIIDEQTAQLIYGSQIKK